MGDEPRKFSEAIRMGKPGGCVLSSAFEAIFGAPPVNHIECEDALMRYGVSFDAIVLVIFIEWRLTQAQIADELEALGW